MVSQIDLGNGQQENKSNSSVDSIRVTEARSRPNFISNIFMIEVFQFLC